MNGGETCKTGTNRGREARSESDRGKLAQKGGVKCASGGEATRHKHRKKKDKAASKNFPGGKKGFKIPVGKKKGFMMRNHSSRNYNNKNPQSHNQVVKRGKIMRGRGKS